MADQVMTVDGNFKPYIEGARKAEDATRKVAKATDEAGRNTGKMLEGFSKSLIAATALVGAVAKAASILNEIRDRDKAASARGGDRETQLVDTAKKLGLSNVFGLRKEVNDRSGNATLGGLTSFMSSLGDYNENAKVPLQGADAESLISAYNKGGDSISGENGRDIIKQLSAGASPQSIISGMSKTKSLATPESLRETYLKNQEDTALLQEELRASKPEGDSGLSDGSKARLYDAQNRASNAAQNTMDRAAFELMPSIYQQSVDEATGAFAPKSDGAMEQWKALKAFTESNRQLGSRPNGMVEVK
jgi:hypothetical protein